MKKEDKEIIYDLLKKTDAYKGKSSGSLVYFDSAYLHDEGCKYAGTPL